MIRPEQIINAKFTPINKGTYSAEEVDAFLKTVADSYEESLNQNKELIKKISILADKIESYRNDEEAIKLALLDAHRMSETINKNAKTKADDILTDAETRSKIILDGASRQANQSIEDAREKAKEIVDNARTAVSSLTERAQVETETTIKAAQKKAAEIIAQAEADGKAIIGSSKESFEFYSNELSKVKAETIKFKETIQELCKGQLSLLDGMPEFIAAVNAVSAAAEQVPASDEYEDIPEIIDEEDVIIPEDDSYAETVDNEIIVSEDDSGFSDEEDIIEEPVTYVPEIAEEADDFVDEEIDNEVTDFIPETEDDEDDLFSFIDEMNFDNISENISSDIDDLLPEIPVDDEEDDDNFNGFKVDLDSIEEIDNSSDDDEDDIASLFDSMFDDE